MSNTIYGNCEKHNRHVVRFGLTHVKTREINGTFKYINMTR